MLKKQVVSIVLDKGIEDYVDHFTNLTNKGRSTIINGLVDLVMGTYLDKDVEGHLMGYDMEDGRKKRGR